jgi:hypothetical protein
MHTLKIIPFVPNPVKLAGKAFRVGDTDLLVGYPLSLLGFVSETVQLE